MGKLKEAVHKDSKEIFAAWQKKFRELEGQKAVYYSRGEKPKNVEIVRAEARFVLLKYHSHPKHHRDLYVCALYLSLISGEDRIEIRDVVERFPIIIRPDLINVAKNTMGQHG